MRRFIYLVIAVSAALGYSGSAARMCRVLSISGMEEDTACVSGAGGGHPYFCCR